MFINNTTKMLRQQQIISQGNDWKSQSSSTRQSSLIIAIINHHSSIINRPRKKEKNSPAKHTPKIPNEKVRKKKIPSTKSIYDEVGTAYTPHSSSSTSSSTIGIVGAALVTVVGANRNVLVFVLVLVLVLFAVVPTSEPTDEVGTDAAGSADEEEEDDDDDNNDEEEGEDEVDEPVPAPPVDKGTGILEWERECVGAEPVVVVGGSAVASRSRTPRSRKSRLSMASSLP